MIITENPTIIGFCKKENISFCNFQKNWNPIKTILNKIFRKLKISSCFLYSLEKQCSDDWIIVFDSLMSFEFLNKIKNKYPNKRLIFWYWNDLRYAIPITEIPKGYEIWTYSEKDSQTHKIKHNSQICPIVDDTIDRNCQQGDFVFYIGRDRGRLEGILKIQSQLNRRNIKTNFNIVANRNHFVHDRKKVYSKPIPYNEVIKKIIDSKGILDYYDTKDMGLSFRPFEGLYFNKKIITNNINVLNYDFYSKKRFFILDVDQIDDINSFLDSPLEEPFNLDNYSFKSWLKRFGVI